MRIDLRYTPNTEHFPFRDDEGKACLAILIYPISKKEKNAIHLIRWQMQNNWTKIIIWIARLCATKKIPSIKRLSNEEYAERFL